MQGLKRPRKKTLIIATYVEGGEGFLLPLKRLNVLSKINLLYKL